MDERTYKYRRSLISRFLGAPWIFPRSSWPLIGVAAFTPLVLPVLKIPNRLRCLSLHQHRYISAPTLLYFIILLRCPYAGAEEVSVRRDRGGRREHRVPRVRDGGGGEQEHFRQQVRAVPGRHPGKFRTFCLVGSGLGDGGEVGQIII